MSTCAQILQFAPIRAPGKTTQYCQIRVSLPIVTDWTSASGWMKVGPISDHQDSEVINGMPPRWEQCGQIDRGGYVCALKPQPANCTDGAAASCLGTRAFLVVIAVLATIVLR